MKKISIVMAVYQTKDYNILKKSIISILNQTYKDFEFIICDDGSTDKTYQYLKDFAKKDKRIVLIQNKTNLTLSPALNKCLNIAKYPYIARMDADDISLPNRLEKQLKFLENNKDVSLVGTNIKVINNEDLFIRSRVYPHIVSNKDFIINCPICHPTIMFRKSILETLNGYSEKKEHIRVEDYELFLRMAKENYKMINIQEDLLLYRQDIHNCKQSKYRYCINEFKLRYRYIRKLNNIEMNLYYIIKPLLVGLLPNVIYRKLKKIQIKMNK